MNPERTSGVRFLILGPVQVVAGGRPPQEMAPRHRAVLAYLLLHAGTDVGIDRLIGAIWGDTPPDTARAQIHAAVTAIRRVLREVGAAPLLATRTAGYAIVPEPDQLDLADFTGRLNAAQAQAAGGDPEGAARGIRAALALWRGQPLTDVRAEYVAGARARLAERRLTAVERLAELELSLGRHAGLVDELSAIVAENPLRERLTGQLMLALHRCERKADALAIARNHRTTLVEQQGLDPSRAFVAIERAILQDDPGLDRPTTPTTSAGAPAVPDQGSARDPEPPAAGAIPTPRQAHFLPYSPPDFTGRSAELGRLTGPPASAGGMATIAVIDGMAGIGKTTLAIQAAHRLADRYPDGQLFVDLQAHTAGQGPIDAGDALEILLRQLGVSPERIPASAADRAALWRAELADRRVLALLDNAADARQVRPLLPAVSDSLFLITSRARLVDLDGTQALSLDPLPAKDALELFGTIVGERADAEPIAALDVLQLCGFLPLAVRIVAARLHHRPRWTVEYLADRLRDQHRRLGELSTSERSVAAAFRLSYERLGSDQQRVFRLLGLHPGRDVAAHAAAALADLPLERSEALLEDLLDAHMLLQREPGRYTFHDLLREYARATAAAEEPVDDRRAALARLFDHYLYTARTAVDLLYPYIEKHRMPSIPTPATAAVPIHDPLQATAWLETERANLLAAAAYAGDHEWPAHTSQLATVLYAYLDRRGYHSEALTLHAQAIRACQRRGDKAGEGRALIDLSEVNWRQGRYLLAAEHARRALELCRGTRDRVGEALALNRLGYVYRQKRDYRQALECYGRALALCREIGYPDGEAAGLNYLGTVYARQGHAEQALEHHRQALALCREIGDRHEEADALDNLGLVYQDLGGYEDGRDHHRQARDLYRSLGDRSDEAKALNGLGEVARSMDHLGRAVDDHGAALVLAREVGNRPEQARAHSGLAHAHRDAGRLDQAREHAKQALELYADLGVPEAEEVRAFLAGLD